MVFDLGEGFSTGQIARRSSLVLANSHCVAERYREALRPWEAAVLYQGVQVPDDVEPSFPAQGDGLRCVVVGSIGFSKRQEEAIRAVALLGEQGARAELLIVGEGDPRYEKLLRDLVVELDVGDRVNFLGQLESANPVIAGADVVVQCSRHEAFGRVTVEGMLAGKPVVGARSAGTAELIRDGETGLLYEPGDVEQLAAALKRLIDDSGEACKLGATAQEWARSRFTEERYATELLALLESK
jgi:glycosyltransferase involved in cell wall biosynthesis